MHTFPYSGHAALEKFDGVPKTITNTDHTDIQYKLL